ncbi:MAG: hypothetical protein JWQ55_4411, partial [Rhodopila sp.]|nr:hypothetical protein [Rhodopila sp.]
RLSRMIRPMIALLNTQTYIVAIVTLVFTDSGHLRTTLVVTPSGLEGPQTPQKT